MKTTISKIWSSLFNGYDFFSFKSTHELHFLRIRLRINGIYEFRGNNLDSRVKRNVFIDWNLEKINKLKSKKF